MRIVQLRERRVDTWEDLRDNNITPVFATNPKGNNWTLNKIRTFQMKYSKINNIREESKYVKQMLLHKNVCASTFHLTSMGATAVTLRIHNTVHSRLSNVEEVNLDCVWQMKGNRPWFNRLVHNLMRFHECKLSSLPKQLVKSVHLTNCEIFGKSNTVELMEQLIAEKNEESDFGMLKGSLLAFVVSSLLSFLILFIEIKKSLSLS